MIRDDVPFDQVLSADLVYVGAPGVVAAAYSQTDNEHYRAARVAARRPRRTRRSSCRVPAVDAARLAGLLAGDTAGVITTRAAGEAFFSAGTNRRMWRFTAHELPVPRHGAAQGHEPPGGPHPPGREPQPGRRQRLFHNALRRLSLAAWTPWRAPTPTSSGTRRQMRVVHTPGQVQQKYLINAGTFPFGYVTTDDRWDNYWREGRTRALGWRGAELRRLRRRRALGARSGGQPRVLRVPGREGVRSTSASGRRVDRGRAPRSSASRDVFEDERATA